MDRAKRVMMVSMEDFKTLLHRVTLPRTPLALAPNTYSLFSSSSTVARTCRIYLADMAMARVRAGRMALCTVVPLEITGSSFHRMENSCIRSRATKKFGRLLPTKLKTRRK